MAARANVYSIDTLNDQDTVSGQTTTKNIYALQPLALTEYLVAADNGISYANMTAAQKSDDTGFKQKFYVDDVWHKTDSENKECAIGLLKNDSTTNNYKRHAANRRGKMHIKKKVNNVWTDFIVLNDGGLNTLPSCYFSSTGHKAYVNYLQIVCALTAAYYAGNNTFTITVDNITNPSVTGQGGFTIPIESIIEGYVFPQKFKSIGYNVVRRDYNLGSAGDTIELTISGSNDEGTYVCPDKLTLTLSPALRFVKVYYFSAQDYDNTQDPTTGTPYAMLISEDMYADDRPGTVGTAGIIKRVIDSTGERVLAGTNEKLQGIQLPPGADVDYAYGADLSVLPDGYYYGVPFDDIDGSDGFMYVKVENIAINSQQYLTKSYNQYHPVVPTDYHVTLSANITPNVGSADYTVQIFATIDSGEIPYGGAVVYSKFCETVHPTQGPKNPKFNGSTFSTDPIRQLHGSKLLLSYTCEYDDLLQNYDTYSAPSSTNENWLSGVILNWRNIPNNGTNKN